MARPKGTGQYRENFDHQAYIACAEGGFTDVKLAKLFKVSKSTVNNWKHDHPSFLDSIKRGRDQFDNDVVESCLLKRIKGYRYIETTKEPVKAINPVTGEISEELKVTKTVSKSVAPDVTGIIFFLKNRNPERWRDRQHLEHAGKAGQPLHVMLSKDDLRL